MAATQLRKKHLLYIEIAMIAVAFFMIAILAYRALFIVHVPKASEVLRLPDDESLRGRQIFPADDPWNTDISSEPVDANSNALVASIGAEASLHPDFGTMYHGAPLGIPFTIVSGDQPKIPVTFQNTSESDVGPYPIPSNVLVEGGSGAVGERHVIVLDKDNWKLYELYKALPEDGGLRWRADAGAIFDLKKNSVQRPAGWTSADAAGLPVFAGLVRYDEVVQVGKLAHAARFTVRNSRRALTFPATHFAGRSNDANLPPMGMRVRLKRAYDISAFPKTVQVILQGLKTYGMILADNGGDWYISGAPDPRWNDDEINTLKNVKGSAFEVVQMKQIVTSLGKAP